MHGFDVLKYVFQTLLNLTKNKKTIQFEQTKIIETVLHVILILT